MRDADQIRVHGRERYVLPARRQKAKRFSIRAGDVVRELEMSGRTPAVCSALRSREFQQSNSLRLVETTGPKSGLSTTVVYTYEFVEPGQPPSPKEDPWIRLRGAMKDIFAELGGGEKYLRGERESFYSSKDSK
ncbi:MAG: hypothetical protein ACRD2S_11805 [Terriglobales bacterium]